jgi:GxxExxY protein
MQACKAKYDLAGQIIGLAMKVHSALGPGFLESVYQNAMILELREAGHKVESEKNLIVKYRETVMGVFIADLLVDDRLIVENKAIQTLAVVHEVQLVNYLAATGLDEGLLLNFGGLRLEYKKKFRVYDSAWRPPF